MGMADKMKEKTLPGTSVTRSGKVVKSIDKADKIELKNANKLIFFQNRKEDVNSMESFKGYKSVESPYVKKLVK